MDEVPISKNLVPGSRRHRRLLKTFAGSHDAQPCPERDAALVEPLETSGQSSRGGANLEADFLPLEPGVADAKPLTSENTDAPGDASQLYVPFQAILDLQRFVPVAVPSAQHNESAAEDAVVRLRMDELHAELSTATTEVEALAADRDAIRLSFFNEARVIEGLHAELNGALDRDLSELQVELKAATKQRDAFAQSNDKLLDDHHELQVELEAASKHRDGFAQSNDELREELSAASHKLRRSEVLSNLNAQRFKVAAAQESEVNHLLKSSLTERNLAVAKEQLAQEEFRVAADECKFKDQLYDILTARNEILRAELSAARDTLASIRNMSTDAV